MDEVKRGKRKVMDGLVGLDRARGEGEEKEGLLAVPNLMDSDSVSLWAGTWFLMVGGVGWLMRNVRLRCFCGFRSCRSLFGW
jgi:hypothetical protein